MYKRGELVLVPSTCKHDEDGWYQCEEWKDGHWHPWDSRHERSDVTDPRIAGAVYLPHSCNEWVVGGPEGIRALVFDLVAALAKLAPEQAEALATDIRTEVAFTQMNLGLDEAVGPKDKA